MADRVKKELEEKRAKLVELRRARDERKALLARAEKGTSEVNPSRLPHVNQKRELMIANLLI
jgi:dynein intermediate chain